MAGETSNAQDTPQFQDALSQLWGRIQDPNQAPPSPTMQPGYPGGPPATALPAVGPRSVQVPYAPSPRALPAMPPAAAPAKAPTPSDDPAVTMPTLPTVPTFRAPGQLNNRIATRTAIEDVNRAHANDAADNKPHWYDRLLGGVAGALAGGLTENAELGANLGSKVTNRAFNRVDQQRQRELEPLFRELNAQKEDEPFYTNADTDSERTFRGNLDVAKEKREQIGTAGRTKALEDKADAYGAKFVAGSEQEDPNSPTGWTAETASGERKPFTPKAGAVKEPKNADEALSAASAALGRGDHKEYDRLTQLAKDLHKQEVDRVREARPEKSDGEKPATHAQFAGVEAKKAAALQKAKTQYDKETLEAAGDPDARKQADDNFREAQQEAQDAYEAEISALGGGVTHQDTSTWRGGAPAAQPGQTPPAQAAPAAKSDKSGPAPSKNKPLASPNSTIKFNGKDAKVTSVKRNPTTDKYAYQIDGKWYTDDDLKPEK